MILSWNIFKEKKNEKKNIKTCVSVEVMKVEEVTGKELVADLQCPLDDATLVTE